jgi:hypothetical protein
MSFHAYSFRDWIIFLVPYLVWCAIGLVVWRKVSRRLQRTPVRALVFALIFAPAVHPVVREAGVIAPASLSFLFVAILQAMPVNWSSAHDKALEFVAYSLGVPFVCTWILAWISMILVRE